MGGSELIRLSYSQIPGLGVLQGFASWVLSIALLLWLVVEFYRLFTQGRADFVTPLVRVGLGFALVHSMGSIGSSLGTMFQGMSQDLVGGAPLHLFSEAFSHAVGQLENEDTLTRIGHVFSLQGLFALSSLVLYMGMFIVKILVIDIAWPICMGIVIVLGLIAVPIGVLPGIATISGWFRSLIEVALWPLVFQMLVALMVGAFRGTLQSVVGVEGAFGQITGGSQGTESVALLGENFLLMMRFWALCVAYSLLCLMTPVIAGMAMRSTPVSVLGGMMASQVLRYGAALVSASQEVSGKYAAGAAAKMADASTRHAQAAEASMYGSAAPQGGAPDGRGGGGLASASSYGAAEATSTSLDRRRYAGGATEGTKT